MHLIKKSFSLTLITLLFLSLSACCLFSPRKSDEPHDHSVYLDQIDKDIKQS
jgi:hypothetical protein